ncbi:hypothetical protein P3T76_012521 [Phytophthora citrophthora]|uniref:Uncharacterized protein n=1 Tax=Phytophthora citrophthora TaxID=4793 RepID=A0AAD9G533_9STRA|nr:hypothetical protein P3T76_012521 [Phytophthora citrophthora]
MNDEDTKERELLRRHIILIRANAPLTGDHPCLTRNNLLYLLRLAPLTRTTVGGGVERTATGHYYGLPKQNFGAFENKFVAKFGYSQHTAKTTLAQVVFKSLMKGFPPTDELNPVVKIAIALPPYDPDLIRQLEHGLRMYLDRESVRLGQFSLKFDHVYTDEQCDELYTIFQKFMDRLEEGRKKAMATVVQEDLLRKHDIGVRSDIERANNRREYSRYVHQCRRVEAQEKIRLEKAKVGEDKMKAQLERLHSEHERLQKYMRDQQKAAVKRIALDTPRVNVAKILADALIDASKMQD